MRMSTNDVVKLRESRGHCGQCGIQTHKIKTSFRGKQKRDSLTIEGVVLHGRCLLCHPVKDDIPPPFNPSYVGIPVAVPVSGNVSAAAAARRHQQHVNESFVLRNIARDDATVSDIINIMVSYPESKVVQEAGCEKLKILARDADNKRAIASAGGISIILATMRRHLGVPSVQAKSLAALCNVVSMSSANKTLMAEADAIPNIVGAMENFPNDESVQEEACILLFNLTNCPKSLFFVRNENPHKLLEAAAFKFPAKCGHVVRKVLNNLILTEKRTLELMEKSEIFACRDILNAMKAHPNSIEVQEMGCSKLKILARDADNKIIIHEAKGIPVILSAIKRFKKKPNLIVQACAALCNISCRSMVNKRAIAEAGVIPEIIEVMKLHPFRRDVQAESCFLLYNLTVCPYGLTLLKNEKPKKVIKKAGKRFSSECKKSSREMLERLCV